MCVLLPPVIIKYFSLLQLAVGSGAHFIAVYSGF